MLGNSTSYVYFKKLLDDAAGPHAGSKPRPELERVYAEGVSLYENNLTSENHGFGSAQRILAIANTEAQKEQMLLSQMFSSNLKIDRLTSDNIKQLTEAINDAFQFRSIYERNKALLLDDNFKGQKGVFSYFHTYLLQAMKDSNWEDQLQKYLLVNKKMTIKEAAMRAFMANKNTIINDAINRWLSAGVELEGMDEKHQAAYQEILSFIQSHPNKNIFMDSLYEKWGIEDFFKETANLMARRSSKKNYEKALKTAADKTLSKNVPQKGGYSLEILIDQVLTMTAERLSSENVTVHGGAGGANARPDNIVTFNFNTSAVDDALRKIQEEGSTRQSAVNAFGDVSKDLAKMDSGFIVYVNDKNYTLNDKFSGMSAGTDWTLTQVQSLLGGIVQNIDQLVYNILQTGGGAIYEGATDQPSEVLAGGIAYYLFDDYDTIGQMTPGGQAIHVLGLNGMLIPLSAFLFALGTALQDVAESAQRYVKVNISAPHVADGDHERYFKGAWERQAQESLENTRISIHFANNLLDFVRGYLK